MTAKTSHPTKTNKVQSKSKKYLALCIFCYVIVPLFFLTFYLLMTETYEDILQHSSEVDLSLGQILNNIYHYIPRLGEFYQHIAIHYMTIQTSFGLDIVFRILTALMSSGLIYLLTFFVLKRRPKLEIKDAVIFLGFFISLLGLELSEVFLYHFSYVHNYILAFLVSIAFLLPFRLNSNSSHPLALIGMVILGFLFGISTEIVPIAFLIILCGLVIYVKISQKLTIKEIFQKYKLQAFGLLGLLLGLLFFYCGAGISSRTGGAYGEVFDYVKLTDIFSQPIYTIGKLVQHAWFNIRYLAFAIFLMLFTLLSEYVTFKKDRKNSHLVTQICLFTFCVLFTGATSLISVADDLYPRFMMPIYLAVFISFFIFIKDHFFIPQMEHFFTITCSVFACIALAMYLDMTYGMVVYYNQMRESTPNDITIVPGSGPSVQNAADKNMLASPIFRFMQLTPYHWGESNDYLKYNRPYTHSD